MKFLDKVGMAYLWNQILTYFETVVNIIDKQKADIDSPNLTGTPEAPTPLKETNTDQIATCKFVHTVVEESISKAMEGSY